jgi:hypothetical protein
VYATRLDDQKLTFCVSGQLWNRSLVMLDVETESLWSHLLGRGMEGRYKGTSLKVIPSDMTTWSAWRKEYPQTTVLDLRRSSRQFVKEFYKDPARFVVGFVGNFEMNHVSMVELLKQPIANVDARGLPLLVAFDPASTSTRIFHRKVGEDLLTFRLNDQKKIQDNETGSIWARNGDAVEGSMKGRKLKQQVAIPSFRRAWKTFHPESREIDLATSPEVSE